MKSKLTMFVASLLVTLQALSAQQVINVGTAPNSGDGDTLRSSVIKTNDNFTELYDTTSSQSSSISSLSSSLAGKADQTTVDSLTTTVNGKASQAALDSLTTTVAGKASQSSVDTLASSISGKADTTTVNTALALKADKSTVDALTTTVGTKASQSALDSLTTTVGTKASQTDLDTLSGTVSTLSTTVAGKADTTTVNTALALKADTSTVNTALGLKADSSTVSALATTVSGKADTTTVNTALALKADASAVTSALALKADATALTSGLALKADQTTVDALTTTVSGKASQSSVDSLTTTVGTKITSADATELIYSQPLKPAVTVAATTNQTLSGLPTIDGSLLVDGSIALLTAQSTASQNGPWVTHSGSWTRPVWYAAGSTTHAVQYSTTLVRVGTVYRGTTWRLTTAAPITIDTTATTWAITPLSLNATTTTGLPVAANPSASVGLTPVNGVATTYMVSDSAPALSQSIAPIWTGIHKWSLTEPRLELNQSGAATDFGLWDFDLATGVFCLRTRTDADAAGVSVFCATRSATTTVNNLAFGSNTGNPTYSFLGSGATSFGGFVTAGSFTVNGTGVPVNGIYRPTSTTLGLAGNSTALGSLGSTAITLGNATTNPTFGWLGTGLATFSTLAAANLNVTGTAVPATGIYRAVANTLDFASATTHAGLFDATQNFIHLKGKADQSYSLQVPTTGFSVTIAAGVAKLILNPAGTLATGTVTMPAAPVNGQEIEIVSEATVTSATISANSGQTILNAPSTLVAGIGIMYIYNLSGTQWLRLH